MALCMAMHIQRNFVFDGGAVLPNGSGDAPKQPSVGILPLVEDVEIEHGDCEYARYNHRLHQAELYDLMHPGMRAVFDKLVTEPK